MKKYYKIVFTILFLLGNLLLLAPWLISAKSDIAFGLGVLDLTLLIPASIYLGKWCVKDIKGE
jgi:hypothetical protein